jgi:hypothetical protein
MTILCEAPTRASAAAPGPGCAALEWWHAWWCMVVWVWPRGYRRVVLCGRAPEAVCGRGSCAVRNYGLGLEAHVENKMSYNGLHCCYYIVVYSSQSYAGRSETVPNTQMRAIHRIHVAQPPLRAAAAAARRGQTRTSSIVYRRWVLILFSVLL